MGVRGTPRQDLAFRAHEMRILRRSVERLFQKRAKAKIGMGMQIFSSRIMD